MYRFSRTRSVLKSPSKFEGDFYRDNVVENRQFCRRSVAVNRHKCSINVRRPRCHVSIIYYMEHFFLQYCSILYYTVKTKMSERNMNSQVNFCTSHFFFFLIRSIFLMSYNVHFVSQSSLIITVKLEKLSFI